MEEIENRATKAIKERRKHQAPSASAAVSEKIWANELILEVGAQMVHDVRADLEATKGTCSVCYIIAGEEGATQTSGDKCPKIPLTGEDKEWVKFKNDLKFPGGIMC